MSNWFWPCLGLESHSQEQESICLGTNFFSQGMVICTARKEATRRRQDLGKQKICFPFVIQTLVYVGLCTHCGTPQLNQSFTTRTKIYRNPNYVTGVASGYLVVWNLPRCDSPSFSWAKPISIPPLLAIALWFCKTHQYLLVSMDGSNLTPKFWIGDMTQGQPLGMFYPFWARMTGSGISIKPVIQWELCLGPALQSLRKRRSFCWDCHWYLLSLE